MSKLLLVITVLFVVPFFSFAQVDYATKVQPIFSANCSCHLGGGQSGVQLDDYAKVIASVGVQYGKKVITPGSSATSPLYEKISSATPTKGVRMPFGGSALAQADIDIIKKWIDEGAKDKPTFIAMHDVNAPKIFSLEQNFPNPYNPSTVISYQLPVTSKVSLKIYDLLGREIATLVNEYKTAGKYSYQFSTNTFHLPSGVYMYRLQTGNYVETKRMVLTK